MEKIVKVGTNNVEVRTIVFETISALEKDGIVSKTESYGQARIDSEKTQFQKDLLYWQALDEKAYKDKKILEAQTRIDKLALIQLEMNKVVL